MVNTTQFGSSIVIATPLQEIYFNCGFSKVWDVLFVELMMMLEENPTKIGNWIFHLHCNIAENYCRFNTFGATARNENECVKLLLNPDGASAKILSQACSFQWRDSSDIEISVVSLGYQNNAYSFAVSAPAKIAWVECLN
jgi:hypothetical protein